MMYYRGTLAEFTVWHDAAKIAEGIPIDGRVGVIVGIPVPQNQRTTAYAIAIPHPVNKDDYIWHYDKYPDAEKTSLLQAEAIVAGWEFETEAV